MLLPRKYEITSIIIHAFLMMYGDVILMINSIEDGVSVEKVAVADGGTIIAKENGVFSNVSFCSLLDVILGTDFPSKVDETSSVEWEIKFQNNHMVILQTGWGTWNTNILSSIISKIDSLLQDDNPTSYLKDIVSF